MPGQAKVAEQCLATVPHENVSSLNIPMNDCILVEIGDGSCDLQNLRPLDQFKFEPVVPMTFLPLASV